MVVDFIIIIYKEISSILLIINPFPSSRGMWPNSRECLRIGKFAAMYPPSKATFTIPLRKKEIEDKRPQPESCKTI